MASVSGSSWSKFVQDNLLSSNFFDAIYLLSSYGELIFSNGPKTTQEECRQFVGIFDFTNKKQDLSIYQNGFRLGSTNNIKVHYKVYKKTYCSMYCVSDNRQNGLIICNLPYGMLLTTYCQPVKPQEAVDLVERTCALLRQ